MTTTTEHKFSNGTVAWIGGLDYRRWGEYACFMETGWHWAVMQGARRGAYVARSGFALRSDDAAAAMHAAFLDYVSHDQTDPDPDFRR